MKASSKKHKKISVSTSPDTPPKPMRIQEIESFAENAIRSGQPDKALSILEQACQIKKNSLGLHSLLLNTYIATGNIEETTKLAKKLERKHKDTTDVGLLYCLGHFYNTIAEAPERALAYFKKALKLSPQSSELHQGIAECFLYSGDSENAAKHSLQAISINKRNTQAYWMLARLKNKDINDQIKPAIERLITDKACTEQEKINSHFALAWIHSPTEKKKKFFISKLPMT